MNETVEKKRRSKPPSRNDRRKVPARNPERAAVPIDAAVVDSRPFIAADVGMLRTLLAEALKGIKLPPDRPPIDRSPVIDPERVKETPALEPQNPASRD